MTPSIPFGVAPWFAYRPSSPRLSPPSPRRPPQPTCAAAFVTLPTSRPRCAASRSMCRSTTRHPPAPASRSRRRSCPLPRPARPGIPCSCSPADRVKPRTGYGAWLETAFGPVRRARDVVLLDFRGTGRSGALNCAAPDFLAPDYATAAPRAVRECAREHGSGVVFYTHREVVEDIERVRTRARVRRDQSLGRIVRHAHRPTLRAQVRHARAQRRARRRDTGQRIDLRVGAAFRRGSAAAVVHRLRRRDGLCACVPDVGRGFRCVAHARGNRHDHGRAAPTRHGPPDASRARSRRHRQSRPRGARTWTSRGRCCRWRSPKRRAVGSSPSSRWGPPPGSGRRKPWRWASRSKSFAARTSRAARRMVPPIFRLDSCATPTTAASSCFAPSGRALPCRPKCSSPSPLRFRRSRFPAKRIP